MEIFNHIRWHLQIFIYYFLPFSLISFCFLIISRKKDFIILLDLAGFAANLSDNGCHLLLLYPCNNGRNGTKQQESI